MRQTLMIKKIFIFIILLSLSAVFGCIEENPALLNPPQETSTMYIRFINLSNDKANLKLLMNSTTQSALTVYSECSDTLHPPADSVIASVATIDGAEKYKMKNKIKFIGNTFYSLISLKPPGPPIITDSTDTIISIGTISSFTNRYNTAYVNVLNAYPDTNFRFSVVLGCPNGMPLVQNLGYRAISNALELPAGDNEAISVLTEKTGTAPVINLYSMQIKAGGQYTIIIYNLKNDSIPEIKLLDEFKGLDALTKLETNRNNDAKVRTINFSSQQVTVKKSDNPDKLVADDVPTYNITGYQSVIACNSQSSDTFTSLVNDNETSWTYASLEVQKNFTIAVFDSADSPAKLTLAIPPVRLSEPLDGRAEVRVVNASVNFPGFALSLGARDKKGSSSGYIAGELISNALPYGQISTHQVLTSGLAPLSIYTTEDPSRLLFNTLVDFKPDKKYIIFIIDEPDSKEKIKVSFVEENDTTNQVNFLSEGVFTQVVHLIPDAVTITVAAPPVLNNAKIYFSGSFATIMNPGNATVSVSGSQVNFSNDIIKRNLIIATGLSQNKELLLFQYMPLKIDKDNYKRRFINGCKEFPAVDVAMNCDTCYVARNIAYGTVSTPDYVTLERNSSFLFINPADSSVIKRIDGLTLPFGKNVTFILGGNKQNGYTIVQQQEF
ncbi:MAG: DUF4397 domain-containing protein [Bacteroidetes bacterium]|nr:MAG: DUF4397 domain-containing protein [Bacteroidota bacterium]